MKSFFKELEINYSDNSWRHIFYHIDGNHDDQIDLDEFLYFLFPEDDTLMVPFSLRILYTVLCNVLFDPSAAASWIRRVWCSA